MLINDAQVETNLREVWEHEGSKDEMNIVLQGPEQYFWKGTEAGWMGCYDFPGETWAGDGSVHTSFLFLQEQIKDIIIRVSWEQEVSAFKDLVVTSKYEWDGKRRAPAH